MTVITRRVGGDEGIERDRSLLFDLSPAAMLLIDADSRRVLDVNPAANAQYGYTRKEFLVLRSDTILNADRWSSASPPSPCPEREITRHRRKDGTLIDVAVSTSRIVVDGRDCCLIVASDITVQTRMEAALRSSGAALVQHNQERTNQSFHLESLGQFTGGIAHDFNNLLTVILANAQLLAASYAHQSTVPEELHDVIEAAERGSDMVRRLLRFARRQPVELVPVALGSLARDLSRTLRQLLPEHITVVVDCADAECTVLADAGAIEQIVLNLATNARDAMSAGGSLEVSVRRTTLPAGVDECGERILPGEYVTLSVRDTGSGIDDATRQRMFEPFFTTKANGKGTGLGLAMTCGLVRQHNGVIELASQPGEGTTIKISIPAVTAT